MEELTQNAALLNNTLILVYICYDRKEFTEFFTFIAHLSNPSTQAADFSSKS
jgi:hypothetical protein